MAVTRYTTDVVSVAAQDPDPQVIARAAEVVRGGGLVVLPTDTVYGLVCDPRQTAAVDRIYAVKQRSRDLPLVLLLHSTAQVGAFIEEVPPLAVRAMQEFWPGALTAVLRTTRLSREMQSPFEVTERGWRPQW